MRPSRPTKDLPWMGDPLGDTANAHKIPEDDGLCMLCFGQKTFRSTLRLYHPCPLCKGTGQQTREMVLAYKRGELALDFLTTLA